MVTSFNGTSHIYIDSMSQHGENPQILEMKNQPLEGTMFMCQKKTTLPETNVAPEKRCFEDNAFLFERSLFRGGLFTFMASQPPPPKHWFPLITIGFPLARPYPTYTWNPTCFGIENHAPVRKKKNEPPHSSFGLLNLESKWVVWKHPPNSRVWKGRETPGGFKGKRGNGETFVLQCIYIYMYIWTHI